MSENPFNANEAPLTPPMNPPMPPTTASAPIAQSAPVAEPMPAPAVFTQDTVSPAQPYSPQAGMYAAPVNAQFQAQPGVYAVAPEQPTKSFFGRLFDLSFSSYVTPSLVKIFYIVTMIAIILEILSFVLIGSVTVSEAFDSAGIGFVFFLFFLLIGAVVFLISMISLRAVLEVIIAVVRNEENTRVIKEKLEAQDE